MRIRYAEAALIKNRRALEHCAKLKQNKSFDDAVKYERRAAIAGIVLFVSLVAQAWLGGTL
ncbi:hypothetical protein [Methylomonas sp. MgM2]